jgi:hypothetical protein
MSTTPSTYTNFLSDPDIYDALEEMWISWFNEITEEHDIELQSFYNNLNSEGEKIRDANPVFSGLEPHKNRLLRILQTPIEEVEGNYIQAWTDTFGAEEDEEGIEELVIDLVLSEENKAIAKRWVVQWLVNDLERAGMEEILEVESVLLEEEEK